MSGRGARTWVSLLKVVRLTRLLPERPFRHSFQVLVTHQGHDADGSKSGKSKGAGTGLGQINAAASHIGASIRDRDRNGMTIFLVGDLNFGTEGQRFVGRRHRAIGERGTAGSFGSTLRGVPQGVHRRDTVFSPNWNLEQTKHERSQ